MEQNTEASREWSLAVLPLKERLNNNVFVILLTGELPVIFIFDNNNYIDTGNQNTHRKYTLKICFFFLSLSRPFFSTRIMGNGSTETESFDDAAVCPILSELLEAVPDLGETHL